MKIEYAKISHLGKNLHKWDEAQECQSKALTKPRSGFIGLPSAGC